MRKTLTWLAGIALLLLAGHTADAGFKSDPITVFVNESSKEAGGQIGAVRASSDSTQWIVCTVDASDDIPNPGVICSVSTAAGVYRSCVTTAPKYLQPVSALNNDSLVKFRWRSDGQCVLISVSNGSYQQPKQP